MKIKMSCPYAKHDERMRIICTKRGGLCGNQYFRSCKGWWALTVSADACPIRRNNDGN